MICAFGIIIADVSISDNKTHFDNYHKIAGLIIVVVTLIQPVLIAIFALPVVGDKIKEAAPVVFMLSMAQHRVFGQLLFVAAIVNIGTGLIFYHTQSGIWVCFGVWIMLIVIYWFLHELLSITNGFNTVVGKPNEGPAPMNIFGDVYAFITSCIQVIMIVLSTVLFIAMIVLFAVYEADQARPYLYSKHYTVNP